MEDYDDYQDQLDAAEDQLEDMEDMQESQLDNLEAGTYSQPRAMSDIWNWFWRVVRLLEPKKVIKVGNLNKTEIGDHGVSVRDAMNLAELGEIFNHRKFGEYWQNRAVVTSATSMSKNGWFAELSVIQKKVRERSKSGSGSNQSWRLFGRKTNTTNQGEQLQP